MEKKKFKSSGDKAAEKFTSMMISKMESVKKSDYKRFNGGCNMKKEPLQQLDLNCQNYDNYADFIVCTICETGDFRDVSVFAIANSYVYNHILAGDRIHFLCELHDVSVKYSFKRVIADKLFKHFAHVWFG